MLISGARDSVQSTSPSYESVIEQLFKINSETGQVKLADNQKLDRESQKQYVLIIKADDR